VNVPDVGVVLTSKAFVKLAAEKPVGGVPKVNLTILPMVKPCPALLTVTVADAVVVVNVQEVSGVLNGVIS
jgi:hypothetical protein